MVLPLIIGAGLALGAAGAITSFSAARSRADYERQIAQANQRVAGFEREIETKRRQTMELDARRRQLEVIRTAQRARAMGLATATSQGAQGGSGLQGAYGQFSGATGTNLLGIFQSLQLGRETFDLNDQISRQRIHIAGLQGQVGQFGSQAALGSGLSSLGGSLFNSATSLNSLAGGSTSFSGGYGASSITAPGAQ